VRRREIAAEPVDAASNRHPQVHQHEVRLESRRDDHGRRHRWNTAQHGNRARDYQAFARFLSVLDNFNQAL
jgi:hypothetical protein